MATPTRQELNAFWILRHPALYQAFITPVDPVRKTLLPMRDWFEKDNWGKARLYVLPSLPWDHLLFNDIPIDKYRTTDRNQIDRNDIGCCYDYGGRTTSKSWTDIHDAVQVGFIRPGEETMLTSRDENHLTKRQEEVWRYPNEHPFIKLLVARAVTSDPYPIIMWKNGHKTKAIMEGYSGSGENYLGEHVHRKIVDEFQLTSAQAWKNLHDASSENGSVIRATGVSDGRRDTPAHEIRNDPSMKKYVHIRGQHVNSWFTPEVKRRAIRFYHGLDTQEYRQNIDAEEGEPYASVWNLRDILKCTKVEKVQGKGSEKVEYVRCPVSTIVSNDKDTDWSVERFPPITNDELDIWLVMDVGQSPDPSIINVVGMEDYETDLKPIQMGIIELLNVPYPTQAKILLGAARYYNAKKIGIDYTGMDGVAIMDCWDEFDDPFAKRMQFVKFDARAFVEINTSNVSNIQTKEKNISSVILHEQEEVETKSIDIKHFCTNRMKTRFQDRMIELLYDMVTSLEFTSEVRKATSGRFAGKQWIYVSPKGDHRITTLRILEYMIYLYLEGEMDPTEGSMFNGSLRLVPIGSL